MTGEGQAGLLEGGGGGLVFTARRVRSGAERGFLWQQRPCLPFPWEGVLHRPHQPGICVSTGHTGLPVPPLFSWTSSFLLPSCSSCCSASGQPERGKYTENILVLQPQTTEACEQTGLFSRRSPALMLCTWLQGPKVPPNPPASLPKDYKPRPTVLK